MAQTTFDSEWKGERVRVEWGYALQLHPVNFVCGYCGAAVSSNDGYSGSVQSKEVDRENRVWQIMICHHCGHPTFFGDDEQVPGPIPGNEVAHLPDEVASLYNEARSCCKVSAFTASVLCTRKLLMNIAVKPPRGAGAKEGLNFVQYVNYLSEAGYLPPGGEEWVDSIRDTGNIATHEIKVMHQTDAERLITFAEMLLKFMYEFPAKVGGPQEKVNVQS